MKVPYSQYYTSTMEENSGSPSSSSSSVSQNHNGGGSQAFGSVNVSVANNKHQPGGGENDSGGGGGGSGNGNGNGGGSGGGGGGGGGSGGGGGGGGSQGDNKGQKVQYTMPGVLHFLQHEWASFELERSQWELDRAEFQARIAFLQGERMGQENLKTDLVRRIKMLEYALKEERAKYHKLKYGTDLVIQEDGKPTYEEGNTCMETEGGGGDDEPQYTLNSNNTWKKSRKLLREYLQEIGYTDTIIDVRSNRVRFLLGLNNNTDSEDTNTPALNGNKSSNKCANDYKTKKKFRNSAPWDEAYKQQPSSIAEAMIRDTEGAVMVNFEFLDHTDIDMEEDENDGEEEIYDSSTDTKQNKTSILLGEDVDAEAEKVLNELNLITEHEESIINVGIEENRNFSNEWNPVHRGLDSDPRRPCDEGTSSLGLGELAQLTVSNDIESAFNMPPNHDVRKSWNAKYTLRSHFDCVRALVFHPFDSVLITASDDHTLKLWNLQKTVSAKKSASLDVEPLYTFRSHTGPVLCLAMDNTGNHCFSGGLDSKIHCWTLPSANIDPYDSYDPSLLNQTLTGHTDAVWGLSMCHPRSQLLSVSADGTVKLWSPSSKVPLLNTYTTEEDKKPTSVDFIRDEPHKLVVAYEKACVIFDAETGSVVSRIEGEETKGINRLVAHPILPWIVAANEDRHIRFYDHRTATLAHSIMAHLDAVTSLAVDPNGLYLLSGSHDCSIRLWNMDNKTCVQEITVHRKKFDECILDVAFHPSQPFIASAGADALAKVFV